MDVQPITVPQSLAYVLNSAGDKSNVDFGYLVQTAQRESSLNPTAKAPSSSAVGLFQFLESTWLQVMKEEGPRLGYQSYADAIGRDSDGDYAVKDKTLRAEILKLREDPQVAADMAAAFTEANGDYLKGKFGRMPSPGELYIAHFLGPQGAEKLFNAGLANPDEVAAKLFPKQARANPPIFYSGGHARTIREVYKALVAKHDGIVATPLPEQDPAFVAQQLASAPPGAVQPPSALPSRFSPTDMSFTAMFATESPPATPEPLLAIAEATAAPLIAAATREPLIDLSGSAAGAAPASDPAVEALGFVPLPAPAPLVAPEPMVAAPIALLAEADAAPAVAAAQAFAETSPVAAPEAAPPVQDDGRPKPRVLMTPRTGGATNLFLTQLYGQGEEP